MFEKKKGEQQKEWLGRGCFKTCRGGLIVPKGGFPSALTSESGRATVGSGGWFSWMFNLSKETRILTTSPSRIVPLRSFCARGNNTSVLTTRAMARAP